MKIDLSCRGFAQTTKGHVEGCNCDRQLKRWRKSFMTALRHPYPMQIPRTQLAFNSKKETKNAKR
jgi:hypothetical protein